MWDKLLFLTLITVFFPWSLLVLLLLFGWNETVRIFRNVVLDTFGPTVIAVVTVLMFVIGLMFVALTIFWAYKDTESFLIALVVVGILIGLRVFDSREADRETRRRQKLGYDKSDTNRPDSRTHIYNATRVGQESEEKMVTQPLVWSVNPGAFELHLRRRYNNLLFLENRRNVVQSDIDAARTRDILDAKMLDQEQRTLFEEFLLVDEAVGTQQIREKVDTLIETAFGIGGPADEILAELQKLREVITNTSRKSFAEHSELLAKLEDAEQAHKSYMAEFFVPFLAQMSRKDSPIPADEIVPSLLMQEPNTIRVVMRWADANFRQVLRNEAVSLLREALQQGWPVDRMPGILAAFEMPE